VLILAAWICYAIVAAIRLAALEPLSLSPSSEMVLLGSRCHHRLLFHPWLTVAWFLLFIVAAWLSH